MKTLKVLISFDNSDRSVNPQNIFFLLRNGRDGREKIGGGDNKTAEKNYIHLFFHKWRRGGIFHDIKKLSNRTKAYPISIKVYDSSKILLVLLELLHISYIQWNNYYATDIINV